MGTSRTEAGLLRFLTCGSVDDGKSTLIGRLLYDAHQVYEDQLAALEKDSRRHGTTGDDLDLALLVDGLEAEREQGITIDVAYRYFATPRRSFIVADTPGHEQYTRNMATGASHSDLAVILVDARKGLLSQTRRHATICSLLGLRHVVLAVNKIDLIGYDQTVFDRIVAEFEQFCSRLAFATIKAIPISARHGDNVARPSDGTRWYTGPTLIEALEQADVEIDHASKPFRLFVQWVNRPRADFRGFSGTVNSGVVRRGEPIVVAASGRASRIHAIYGPDGGLDAASAGDAVTVTLEDEIDIARGALLASPERRPFVADQFCANIVWLAEQPLLPNRDYLLRIGTLWSLARITSIKHKLSFETNEHLAARHLEMNEVGVANLSVSQSVPFDRYDDNRETGAFILVDRFTHETAAAGMIVHPLRRATNIHRETTLIEKSSRALMKDQKPACVWFTGLSGSGKSTFAKELELMLHEAGRHTMVLDGDNVRHGLNQDLGFTDSDRVENIRRVGEVARLMTEAGLIVLCSFISPFHAERDMVRRMFEKDEFIEVFVDTSLDECIRRDPKGLYAKAMSGEIPNFTGINSPYETPKEPEFRLVPESGSTSRQEAFRMLIRAQLQPLMQVLTSR